MPKTRNNKAKSKPWLLEAAAKRDKLLKQQQEQEELQQQQQQNVEAVQEEDESLLLPPPARPSKEEATTTLQQQQQRQQPGIKNDNGTGTTVGHLLDFPVDMQVNILTYLRAYDLSNVQQTCRYYSQPDLVHAIVAHTATTVYPASLTQGFDQQPITYTTAAITSTSPSKNKNPSNNNDTGHEKININNNKPYYTFEHLRNMELLVVARVLSQPESSVVGSSCNGNNGFVVSKSWCKAALRWLEVQQEQSARRYQERMINNSNNSKRAGGGKNGKKMSKKQQRMRDRKLSDASPPWPDMNADLLCPHRQLQVCPSTKSARARRRILTETYWKVLCRLYPESTPLQNLSCPQCVAQQTAHQVHLEQAAEQAKLQRKLPLSNTHVRRFYTRTRGVPEQALRNNHNSGSAITGQQDTANGDDDTKGCSFNNNHKKLPASVAYTTNCGPGAVCPLRPGLYYIVPRAWCHGWRRYIKTGDKSSWTNNNISSSTASMAVSSSTNSTTVPTAAATAGGTTTTCHFPPPDAASLLCDAHRLALLPPHLEAYLYGETTQLLGGINNKTAVETMTATTTSSGGTGANAPTVVHTLQGSFSTTTANSPARAITTVSSAVSPLSSTTSLPLTPSQGLLVPGQAPDDDVLNAMRAAGLSEFQVAMQLSAMRSIQQQQQQQSRSRSSSLGEGSHNINNMSNGRSRSSSLGDSNHAGAAAAAANDMGTPATPLSENKNDVLDRENHSVVEIVTSDEFTALEGLWPGTNLFAVSFYVMDNTATTRTSALSSSSSSSSLSSIGFCTPICRECDPTGRQCAVSIKNRARGWVKKSADKPRAPASLEY